jgi:hypothetical protein
MSENSSNPCEWCGKPYRPRRGGSPQRFCGSGCRTAFWSALRRWGERAIAAGVLTIPDVRNGDPAACTLLSGADLPEEVRDDHSRLTQPVARRARSCTSEEALELAMARAIAARRRG